MSNELSEQYPALEHINEIAKHLNNRFRFGEIGGSYRDKFEHFIALVTLMSSDNYDHQAVNKQLRISIEKFGGECQDPLKDVVKETGRGMFSKFKRGVGSAMKKVPGLKSTGESLRHEKKDEFLFQLERLSGCINYRLPPVDAVIAEKSPRTTFYRDFHQQFLSTYALYFCANDVATYLKNNYFENQSSGSPDDESSSEEDQILDHVYGSLRAASQWLAPEDGDANYAKRVDYFKTLIRHLAKGQTQGAREMLRVTKLREQGFVAAHGNKVLGALKQSQRFGRKLRLWSILADHANLFGAEKIAACSEQGAQLHLESLKARNVLTEFAAVADEEAISSMIMPPTLVVNAPANTADYDDLLELLQDDEDLFGLDSEDEDQYVALKNSAKALAQRKAPKVDPASSAAVNEEDQLIERETNGL